jgi:hypothetical protein
MIDARDAFIKEMKHNKRKRMFVKISYYTLSVIAFLGILFVIYVKISE